MTTLSVTVFVLVYVGMALGRVPGLAIDRTGVALLGLIVLLASGDLTLEAAGTAVDMPTIALLFALMILSAQFEHSGFYGWIAHWVVRAARNPKRLLAVLIAVTGVLSAIFTNDVVVFALTPLVATGLLSQKLDARPYLIGLAGAANAGSAATLIGNPQNILIGQAGGLDFWTYLAYAAPPAAASLVIAFLAITATWRLAPGAGPAADGEPAPEIDRFQMAKGLAAVMLLVGLFLTPLPRELSALAVAGLLLMS
ncbi:MAG: SLC13 family permease, partial [Pseudomonadota bacterium]|nr:SLC13 family permease [Pseudomonadota bacterium]